MTCPEECALHIIGHLAVVEGHDPHQGFKGRRLHLDGWALGGLAYDLHDVIALTLTSWVSRLADVKIEGREVRTSRSKFSRMKEREL
jgi:hypothetical protein